MVRSINHGLSYLSSIIISSCKCMYLTHNNDIIATCSASHVNATVMSNCTAIVMYAHELFFNAVLQQQSLTSI